MPVVAEANAELSGRLRWDVYDAETGELLEASDWFENLVTTVGKQNILNLIRGSGGAPAAYFGIGNGTTAASGDTALVGASTAYIVFDSSSTSGTTTTYTITVPSGSANFPHTEYALCTTSTGGILITHLVPGTTITKTTAIVIVYTYQFTQN